MTLDYTPTFEVINSLHHIIRMQRDTLPGSIVTNVSQRRDNLVTRVAGGPQFGASKFFCCPLEPSSFISSGQRYSVGKLYVCPLDLVVAIEHIKQEIDDSLAFISTDSEHMKALRHELVHACAKHSAQVTASYALFPGQHSADFNAAMQLFTTLYNSIGSSGISDYLADPDWAKEGINMLPSHYLLYVPDVMLLG